jgi:putative transposase
VSRYRFIEAEKDEHAIITMCRVLKVSRAAYYEWSNGMLSDRVLEDAYLTNTIRDIHLGSRHTYGAPRVHEELADEYGIRCGRKRVARLMRQAGLQGVHRRRKHRTTRRREGVAPAPDLVERNFTATGPDQLWVADITYVPTWVGFLYVAIVLDVFSRKIVGWSMAGHLRTELVLDALEMAIWHRQPEAGLVHHSDQGCQYTSLAFGRRCRQAGIATSMGSVGDCYDNSMAESFFATLERELLEQQPTFRNRTEARIAVFDFIEGFYNTRRRHSAIGNITPARYEAEHAPDAA